jgi:hypothetical protein
MRNENGFSGFYGFSSLSGLSGLSGFFGFILEIEEKRPWISDSRHRKEPRDERRSLRSDDRPFGTGERDEV